MFPFLKNSKKSVILWGMVYSKNYSNVCFGGMREVRGGGQPVKDSGVSPEDL